MALSQGPFLFCEGGDRSLDKRLFNAIVGTRRIQLKPMGSKYGFRDRIAGYLSAGNTNDVPYIAIRDRDFDYIPADTERLHQTHQTKLEFVIYRACIESYLIDPDLVRQYWVFLHERARPPVPAPPTLQKFDEQITLAAETIADYQAMRWGLASIKPEGQHYWPRLESTWEKDGQLPEALAFDACLAQARNYFEERYRQPTANMNWTSIEAQAQRYQQEFSRSDFFENKRYLTWFHGKDLMTAYFQQLSALGSPAQFTQGNYVRWAVEHLDYERYGDLREIADRCDQLLSSA